MYNIIKASHIPGAPRGLKDQLLRLCQEPPRITGTWHFRWDHWNFDGFISFLNSIPENGCLPFVPERQHFRLLLVSQGHPKRYTGPILNLLSWSHLPLSSAAGSRELLRAVGYTHTATFGAWKAHASRLSSDANWAWRTWPAIFPGSTLQNWQTAGSKLSSKHGSVRITT